MKSIKMSKKSFMKEHKELLDTLKHPTKKKLKKEARLQSKEVKEVKKRIKNKK